MYQMSVISYLELLIWTIKQTVKFWLQCSNLYKTVNVLKLEDLLSLSLSLIYSITSLELVTHDIRETEPNYSLEKKKRLGFS